MSTASNVAAPQPRAPQQRRGHDRVANLLAAAAELFVEKGFDATTMTEIAARAGAAIGTLYLFFPTKQAMAQAILAAQAEELSWQIDALREQSDGMHAATIADQLFALLDEFMAAHPVYSALLDLPGDDEWRSAVRAGRGEQIAALLARAYPPLPAEQAERLAVIVPDLIRIPLMLIGDSDLRDGVSDELRLMLNRHLEAGEG